MGLSSYVGLLSLILNSTSQGKGAWISRYAREHSLYALAAAQLSDMLAGPIYTGGGASNILPSSLKLLLLITVGSGILFFWSHQIQQRYQCVESDIVVR
jgi:hypothetical protein